MCLRKPPKEKKSVSSHGQTSNIPRIFNQIKRLLQDTQNTEMVKSKTKIQKLIWDYLSHMLETHVIDSFHSRLCNWQRGKQIHAHNA